MSSAWHFWVDRGGTFTDIIALDPNGQYHSHKLLSINPKHYTNSAIQGIRDCLGLSYEQAIPQHLIAEVKVGTTVATNALLERKGEPTALITTAGFKDVLKIGQQHRPDIFALDVQLPDVLYSEVIEIEERISADGTILTSLNIASSRTKLKQLKQAGFEAVAIVLMHAWVNPQHEQALHLLAKEQGFSQISVSHLVSPTIKYLPRGDTCVVDAYLTPVMRRYVDDIALSLPDVPLFFMQSNGGLAKAEQFQGKDAILSGPAGGIVGAVKSAQQINVNKIIGFDMGGTSTDVSHFAGDDYERVYQTEISGVKLAVPMMHIHTVAAGGGSICFYQDGRLQVGPASAGAFPGPACYRNGGPLTVTDCNVIIGKIQPALFPSVFGEFANQPLDKQAAVEKINQIKGALAKDGEHLSLAQIASGFIAIAIDSMANAVRKISTQRGYQLDDYSLVSFGGAGGQHACLIAEQLLMKRILIHPYAGVLSAYGIGLAEQIEIKQKTIQWLINFDEYADFNLLVQQFAQQVKTDFVEQQLKHIAPSQQSAVVVTTTGLIKHQGAEVCLELLWPHSGDTRACLAQIQAQFKQRHQIEFGYSSDAPLMLQAINVKIELANKQINRPSQVELSGQCVSEQTQFELWLNNQTCSVKCVERSQLKYADKVMGPAIIIEKTGTNIIELGWQAEVIEQNVLLLTRSESVDPVPIKPDAITPIDLEVFNNLMMSIAEQMGVTLAKTAHSVNIRERLDFSCAIFDANGELVANAPHVPVHLGSMSHSVKHLITQRQGQFNQGDGYLLNSPYCGGTHLPDLTLISPVFVNEERNKADFFVASRAHHADVGGISPGSMPSNSYHIDQEGVLFTGEKIVVNGQFKLEYLKALLLENDHPCRNFQQNLADLSAQLAANNQGIRALQQASVSQGHVRIKQLMSAVQDNAELAVKNAIAKLNDGQFTLPLDYGNQIAIAVKVDQQNKRVCLDFTGTSKQQHSNYNAPVAVTYAAVIYVFRCLVDNAIPLNAGCLRPIDIILPKQTMLSPVYPAAVVAGNVEVSQAVVSCLLLALGKTAASQTTMNNLTFGNADYQYYETLAGGTGAGVNNQAQGFNGCDAVQSHMTNSRLTDPEILEVNFPVLLTQFAIREDSGGIGEYTGGNGLIRQLQFNKPMQASLLTNSRVVAPFGLAGGGNGQLGVNRLVKQNQQVEILTSACAVDIAEGDCLVIETPGGGGYKPPLL